MKWINPAKYNQFEILRLEEEVEKLKKELKKNNLPIPQSDSPNDSTKLKLTISYFSKYQRKGHLYVIKEENEKYLVVIDKENQIFSNPGLTEKDKFYTITFPPEKAEELPNTIKFNLYSSKI